MKTKNFALAIMWVIYLPFILPICLIFGILNGAGKMLGNIVSCMWSDITKNR